MFRNLIIGAVAVVVLALGLLTYCQVVAPQAAPEINQPQLNTTNVVVPAPVVKSENSMANTSTASQTEFTEYVVKKGDTLSEISENYHKNWRKYYEIARDSGVKNPHLIYPGDKLLIRKT